MFDFSAEDITADYGFLLRLVNTFTIDTTDEYYQMCYKVNDMKTFENLVYRPYYFTLCAQSSHITISLHVMK